MEAQPSEDKDMLLTCFNGISDPRGSNTPLAKRALYRTVCRD